MVYTNPFTVYTPEGLSANDAVELFVNVFNDFPKLQTPGHAFLHGPRGSGKSMMFRYLQPDCQKLALGKALKEISFYAVYIPIKNTDYRLTELQRLDEKHASPLLNEHFLVLNVLMRLFDSLKSNLIGPFDENDINEFNRFIDCYNALFSDCGLYDDSVVSDVSIENSILNLMKHVNKHFVSFKNYTRKLSFSNDAIPYEGPICGYLDFLLPLLTNLGTLSVMPKGAIFLLVDDGDNLNNIQTRILNTWVSTRTSSSASIKISTQLRYKTYKTLTNEIIESPHDFSDMNISTVYTASAKTHYPKRIRAIVEKRLHKYFSSTITAEEFFPEDKNQEDAIEKIRQDLIANHSTSGKGYRASDDALRYARPNYIRDLGGVSKSTETYSYAGFKQLVDLSSGIIRNFLEAASLMFEDMTAAGNPFSFIHPGVQSKIVREIAKKYLYDEFVRMIESEEDEKPKGIMHCLQNLIFALGGTFSLILKSERSERRVFSIAISGKIGKEISDVLGLGCEKGYFHKSYIGNKEGTGKVELFILSRKLAPIFNLDPTSFAGYLFVTEMQLVQAMYEPNKFIRQVKNKRLVFKDDDGGQLRLFE